MKTNMQMTSIKRETQDSRDLRQGRKTLVLARTQERGRGGAENFVWSQESHSSATALPQLHVLLLVTASLRTLISSPKKWGKGLGNPNYEARGHKGLV